MAPFCIKDAKEKKGGKAAINVSETYKPSSVIDGYLSSPAVTSGLKRNPENLAGRLKRSFVSCSGWGLQLKSVT